MISVVHLHTSRSRECNPFQTHNLHIYISDLNLFFFLSFLFSPCQDLNLVNDACCIDTSINLSLKYLFNKFIINAETSLKKNGRDRDFPQNGDTLRRTATTATLTVRD